MHNDEFIKRSRFAVPVRDLFLWHTRPGALERLSPPWDPLRVMKKEGEIHEGGAVHLKMKAGPFWFSWNAVHRDYRENRLFRDIQVKGPMSQWVHSHIFESHGPRDSFLEDRISYRLPVHRISRLIMGPLVKKKLERIFQYRHRITDEDTRTHESVKGKKCMRIAVSGARGVIGASLVPFLETGGHEVYPLVRTRKGMRNEIFWDPASGTLAPSLLEGMDAVINLSGEPLGNGAWTEAKKREIIGSRTGSTALLARTMAGMKKGPRILITASAMGYYGNRAHEAVTEKDGPGDDFISRVCEQWEDAAAPASRAGIRVVFLRLGVVLTPAGGALKRLLPAFRLCLGACMGDGSQYLSWVGMDDVLGAVHTALFNKKITGPLNVVSPEAVTNREFTDILGKVLKRPAALALPSWLITALFGEMGKEVLLSGARVIPEKLVRAGYRFRNRNLEELLRHVLGLR